MLLLLIPITDSLVFRKIRRHQKLADHILFLIWTMHGRIWPWVKYSLLLVFRQWFLLIENFKNEGWKSKRNWKNIVKKELDYMPCTLVIVSVVGIEICEELKRNDYRIKTWCQSQKHSVFYNGTTHVVEFIFIIFF